MKIKKNIAISDNGFIFDSNTGDTYSLNPLGTEILLLLKEGKQLPEIQKIILEKYETDNATFEKAYLDFISMIRQYHLTEE